MIKITRKKVKKYVGGSKVTSIRSPILEPEDYKIYRENINAISRCWNGINIKDDLEAIEQAKQCYEKSLQSLEKIIREKKESVERLTFQSEKTEEKIQDVLLKSKQNNVEESNKNLFSIEEIQEKSFHQNNSEKITSEEIKEKIVEVTAFYKNPENIGKVFNDKSRSWIFIRTPEPLYADPPKLDAEGVKIPTNMPIPKKSNFNENKINYRWTCKFTLGQASLFLSKDRLGECGWNKDLLVTGRLTRKYKILNSETFYDTLEDVAKTLNVPTITELSDDEFITFYTISVYQVIKLSEKIEKKNKEIIENE